MGAPRGIAGTDVSTTSLVHGARSCVITFAWLVEIRKQYTRDDVVAGVTAFASPSQ